MFGRVGVRGVLRLPTPVEAHETHAAADSRFPFRPAAHQTTTLEPETTAPQVVTRLVGREVFKANGEPTVQVEVFCQMRSGNAHVSNKYPASFFFFFFFFFFLSSAISMSCCFFLLLLLCTAQPSYSQFTDHRSFPRLPHHHRHSLIHHRAPICTENQQRHRPRVQ